MNEKQLLEQFGLTSDQVDADVAGLEDERADQGVTGPVYYDLHARAQAEEKYGDRHAQGSQEPA